MILDKTVKIKVNSRTVKYYEKLGYDIPKRMGSHGKEVFALGEEFEIDIKDLDEKSSVIVNTACDICSKPKQMRYIDYVSVLDEEGVRTCNDCKGIKNIKTNMKKYGVDNVSRIKEIQDKRKVTMNERYGVDYFPQSKMHQEKVKQTMLDKYGVECSLQLPYTRQRMKEHCLENYGVENPGQAKELREKAIKTNLERYGCEVPTQCEEIQAKIAKTNLERYGNICSLASPEIKEKAQITRYQNGTCASSMQQRYICDLYNGELNYPFRTYNIDCLVDNTYAVEYNGGGHMLNVKLGHETEEHFNVKEVIRGKYLKQAGYKAITFISDTDRLPSDDILIEIFEFSKNYFNTTNHTWVEWYFDENKYRNAEHMDGEYYDFGELRNIKENLSA